VHVGDSICAFNPFYGQGMSSAALSARMLRDALASTTALDTAFFRTFLAAQRKEFTVPWGMAMARDRGYECATGTETAPAWQRRILAAMTWPMFNLITGAAREYPVVDEHFARVFNMDESLTEMMTSPRVIAALIRFKIRSALGRLSLPSGFDPRQDPPGKDWTELARRRVDAR
jgi:hypothetical protein